MAKYANLVANAIKINKKVAQGHPEHTKMIIDAKTWQDLPKRCLGTKVLILNGSLTKAKYTTLGPKS